MWNILSNPRITFDLWSRILSKSATQKLIHVGIYSRITIGTRVNIELLQNYHRVTKSFIFSAIALGKTEVRNESNILKERTS